MLKKSVFLAICLILIFSCAITLDAQELWKPTKPVTLIVPWSAGGATDQITRLCAGELEEALGQKIVIVNQPGASGSVGTKTVMDAARDGYSWASGAVGDLGTYKILGFLDTQVEDWHIYLNVANVMVISVHPDTPYQSFDDLLKAFKERPGEITVSTAGMMSAGRVAMEGIKKVTGIEYEHVTYDGGAPAVVACVAGETEVTAQLASEQADMIRAGKLRPLAVMAEQPLEIADFGVIDPVTKWLPDLEPTPSYFGIFIPRGVPNQVVNTMNKLWREEIVGNEKIQVYAKDRGAIFAPYWGLEGLVRSFPVVQFYAWLYYGMGKAEESPYDLGIAEP
jgi:tripartite-type tricarboxylate transporter receptor subunit TctC